MSQRLVVAATTEPVTKAEARVWARLSSDEPDWVVDMLISSARERAEHLCSRGFTTKTWDLVLDEFPLVELSLERTPVTSITWVKYLDVNGVEQTLSPSAYLLDSYSAPCFLLPATGYSWPATIVSVNAVGIRFIEGWGANPIENLNALRHWIAVTLATDTEFRQSIIAGISVADIPGRYFDRLLDPLTNWA